MNRGMVIINSEPVRNTLSNTLSGLGTDGGTVGGKADSIHPELALWDVKICTTSNIYYTYRNDKGRSAKGMEHRDSMDSNYCPGDVDVSIPL